MAAATAGSKVTLIVIGGNLERDTETLIPRSANGMPGDSASLTMTGWQNESGGIHGVGFGFDWGKIAYQGFTLMDQPPAKGNRSPLPMIGYPPTEPEARRR